jgi:amino acid transporter
MSSKDYDTKPAGGDDVRSVDDDSPPPGTSDAYTAPLHRKLKSRHLQMIAIGGIIGPGLLVGSGNVFHLAGTAGILISFILVGLIVYFIIESFLSN